jgi:ketosteroid isomerase-like protein
MSGSRSDLAQVLAVAQRESAVMAAGDLQGWLDLLAADAIYLPPNSPPKSGSELRAWLAEFLRTSVVEWLEYQDGATEVSGDLAVHDYSYIWRVTPRAGGQPVLGRGKGIQVLHRGSGGAWKVVRNVWNATPA